MQLYIERLEDDDERQRIKHELHRRLMEEPDQLEEDDDDDVDADDDNGELFVVDEIDSESDESIEEIDLD